MVRAARLELTTYGSGDRRSIQLSYARPVRGKFRWARPKRKGNREKALTPSRKFSQLSVEEEMATMNRRQKRLIRLEESISQVAGVGPSRARRLERLGICTVGDLLLHAPLRYEDRRECRRIADLVQGEDSLCRGRVIAAGEQRYRRGQKSRYEVVIEDTSGRLYCRWWNFRRPPPGYAMDTEVWVFGRVSELRPPAMDHPEGEAVSTSHRSWMGRLVPVYPLTEGVAQRWLRGLIEDALEHHAAGFFEEEAGEKEREIPGDLPSHREAVLHLHRPPSLEAAERAKRRLALDELVGLQRELRRRRENLTEKAPRFACGAGEQEIARMLHGLSFSLTEAQRRVSREIRNDLESGIPMRRLLQGDVGSGKTIVAAGAVVTVLASGRPAVLMAPTELLAEQHVRTFSAWLGPLGFPVTPYTASAKPKESNSRQGLFIGTHAMLNDQFALPELGLVIIDEQHKFGVYQREQLLRKGAFPHLLVMTATPIPRTLALTVYGDLDVSVIDESPARGTVKTYLRASERLPRVWEFLRARLQKGQQAYVVLPRVEDSGDSDLKALVHEADVLRSVFPEFRLGILHGRLAPDEREAVMGDFRAGRLHLLAATTVIEVGMDVPAANLMVILNAERFGLSQLHQLRGRIRRSKETAYCILISDHPTPEAIRRLEAMTQCHDGFALAELDLQLRGAGHLLGTEQSGLPGFRFADLRRDHDLVHLARRLVASPA